MKPLLHVANLGVEYPPGARGQAGRVRAVRDVSFAVAPGESVGLIGESGSGKTTVIRAILRLHGKGTRVSGQVLWRDRDLLALPEAELRQVRWQELALVPQSAMNSLDPVYAVGAQIAEAIRTHRSVTQRQAWQEARDLLMMVGVPGERVTAFPHQLSGGMRQRVCLAMALALRPSLIIADEPTTAVDVIVQDRILAEIERLRAEFNLALLLVTHDIGVVAETCERVVVMYGGQVVETGPVAQVFTVPAHPYTMGLVGAALSLRTAGAAVSIPGAVPDPTQAHPGCIFAGRCPFADARCAAESPPATAVAADHQAHCHRAGEAAALRTAAAQAETWQKGA